ncbi:site-specific DNA-methyltransferase, partial [Methanophagales archaeon]
MLFAEELTTLKTLYPPDSTRQEIEHKFKNLIHKELKLGSVVSYVGNKNVPFLRIYRYKEAFAFDFVMDFLKRFGTDSDDYVFDPFSGLGTTMYTSMISGIPSVGIDKLPIAYFIDMQKGITEWFKVLAPGAKVAMVVDNVRFEGELIPVDLVL